MSELECQNPLVSLQLQSQGVNHETALVTNIEDTSQLKPDGLLENGDESENPRTSQATELVRFVNERYDLFHNINKEVFTLDKHSKEVRHLEGRQFRDLLTASFYDHAGKSIRDQSLREAISTLSGIGRYSGKCVSVYRRVAKHEDSYYLDLCEPGNSRAIKLCAGFWEVIDVPPVHFVRSENMEPLPEPIMPNKSGIVDELWEICNIPKSSQLLAVAWLAEALRPDMPYPILELVGEQGSAKSTTQTALRRLIDPNTCDLRAAPKQPDDLFISAGVNHVVSYENISHLSAQMQDAFCIIATGGGFAKRKLYTDADETIIHAKNPVLINGIAPTITAQDLIDRAITIELPVITERRDISNLRESFELNHGVILGALLDIVSIAFYLLPGITLPAGERPRLFEFACLGMAIAEAMNLPHEEFIRQFRESRQESIARTIEASPVATALIEFFELKGRVPIELPAKTLLEELDRARQSCSDSWPKSPKGFSDALRRAVPALRQLGIECKCLGKRGSYVYWSIASKENS